MSTLRAIPTACAPPLLRVRGLSVTYAGRGEGPTPTLCQAALRGVDLDIAPGEVVGILGESGSGKSTLALSLLGLLPANALVEGSILLEDQDLARTSESQWSAIRGAKVAMIFQEPSLALSPVMRIGDQIAEVIRAHSKVSRRQRKEEVEIALRYSGLTATDRIYRAYPHQLSGGELHRAAIAQALACRPSLMIADEPTRSLDITMQAEIQNALRDVSRKHGSALIFITHNPALLAAGFADRVLVMYAGQIVEAGAVAQVYRRPLHPYTKALLQLMPQHTSHQRMSHPSPNRLSGVVARQRLPEIPGSVRDWNDKNPGCAFESRCAARTDRCQMESPEEVAPDSTRRVRCFNYAN